MIPDAHALLDVKTHYVTNQPNSQNDGALRSGYAPPRFMTKSRLSLIPPCCQDVAGTSEAPF